jgi:hypothetical protein
VARLDIADLHTDLVAEGHDKYLGTAVVQISGMTLKCSDTEGLLEKYPPWHSPAHQTKTFVYHQ